VRGLRGGGRRGWCEEWARSCWSYFFHTISARLSKQPRTVGGTLREQLTARGTPVDMVAPEDQLTDLHKLQEGFDNFMLLDEEAQLEFILQLCHFKVTVAGFLFCLDAISALTKDDPLHVKRLSLGGWSDSCILSWMRDPCGSNGRCTRIKPTT
jgi:hypothetical protein